MISILQDFQSLALVDAQHRRVSYKPLRSNALNVSHDHRICFGMINMVKAQRNNAAQHSKSNSHCMIYLCLHDEHHRFCMMYRNWVKERTRKRAASLTATQDVIEILEGVPPKMARSIFDLYKSINFEKIISNPTHHD